MAHTPGPWFRESDINNDGSDWILVTEDYKVIADLRLDDDGMNVSEKEQDANAFLIAAAPELLAACKQLHNCLADWVEIADSDDLRDSDSEAIKLSVAAIAKAEGSA